MKKNYFYYLSTILFFAFFLFITSCGQKGKEDVSRTKVLSENWEIQQNDLLEGTTGEIISSKGFETVGWHTAIVPGTIMGSLVADSSIKDPYFGVNMKTVSTEQFKQSWWYRKTFALTADDLTKSISLRFKGINYRADLWINGKKVANKDEFAGTFRMFTFKINDYIIEGENVIAIEIWQPADGEYTMGFVDWNPLPPDRNMGVFRDVILEINGGMKIRSPFVQAKVNKTSLNAAELTIQTELENSTDKPMVGVLKVDFELGKLEKKVNLEAGENISCIFTAEEYEQLKVKNVKLWWPHDMGEPKLYDLNMEFISDNQIVDKVKDRYGIREIESYLDENKNRAFKVNGKFVLLKGGGWVDDLLLQDTKETIEAQLKYVKHMNLNSIRLEGFWGKDEAIYDLCDKYGILIMAGWSCQWDWEEYLLKPVHPKYGGPVSEEDIKLIARYWQDQMLWLRNHPSIYVWMLGSDKLPAPDLEKKYIELFKKYDTSRPYVTSAGGVGSDQNIVAEEELSSEISGITGMKMLGPYAYTPPIYWFTNTNLGGAYGFNTETCPGPNISPLASLKKMLPAENLWPIDKEYWEYHCGRNAFQTLNRYTTAMDARYGKSANVEEFAFKSQVMNYELMRPMFESFVAHKPKSTGLVQWMLNSAWPEMYWQLYDSYLQPNGAFYAVRNAGNKVHAIYRYGKNDIYLANNHLEDDSGLSLKIKIYDINSKEIFADEWKGDIAGNTSKFIYKLPKIENLTDVWFLDLRVYDQNNTEVDNNFYWLSKKDDVLDYEAAKKLDWPYYTPSKDYADYTALNKLSRVKLEYDYRFERINEHGKITLAVKNQSDTIAFFIFFDVVDGDTEEPILPIFWDDNYVSLLPGEERTYSAYYFLNETNNKKPTVKVKAWNVGQKILK
ncbi:MAG: sugar-binding domain-containing protein [Bacteroidota bacterium]